MKNQKTVVDIDGQAYILGTTRLIEPNNNASKPWRFINRKKLATILRNIKKHVACSHELMLHFVRPDCDQNYPVTVSYYKNDIENRIVVGCKDFTNDNATRIYNWAVASLRVKRVRATKAPKAMAAKAGKAKR